MATEYWVVRILNYNQIDLDHVLVEAATEKEAEQRLRDNGCNAPYIKAMYKARVSK